VPLILLEGPDGAGKTELARALSQEWEERDVAYRAITFHSGPPEPPDRDPFEEYEVCLDRITARIFDPQSLIILDRHHLGDQVYWPYRHDHATRLTEAGLLHVELVVASLGALRVLLCPTIATLRARLKRLGDDYVCLEDLPRIRGEYERLGAQLGYLTPPTERAADSLPKPLITGAIRLSEAAAPLHAASSGSWTGSPFPAVILAGDQLGGSAVTRARYPEFTRPFTPSRLFPLSSGHWLFSALTHPEGPFTPDAGHSGIIPPFWDGVGGVAIVNVNDPGVDVIALERLRPRSKWVALGASASVTLSKAGISHASTWHPAYAQRFRRGELAEYARQLKACVANGKAVTL
jgi:hypothetical protein